MKKAIAAVLLAALMLLAFSACGGHPAAPEESDTSAVPSVAEPSVGEGGGRTLKLFCPFPADDPMIEVINDACADLKDLYPDVTLTLLYEEDGYGFGDSDVAFMRDGELIERLTDDGSLTRLSAFVHEFKVSGELPIYDPVTMTTDDVYSCPTSYDFYVLYENQDLLVQGKYIEGPPEGREEFTRYLQNLKEAGITPIGFSGEDPEGVAMLFDTVLQSFLGRETLASLLNKNMTWNDERVEDAANFFRQLISEGLIDPSWQELSEDEARQSFAEGRCAIYLGKATDAFEFANEEKYPGFIENLNVTVISSHISDGDGFPAVTDPLWLITVRDGTEDPDLVAQYAVELARRIGHYGYLRGWGFTSWKLLEDDVEQPYVVNLIKDITREIANFGSASLPSSFVMHNDDFDTYRSYVERLSRLEKTGAEFASEMAREAW